jgi:geranylgeranyl pyrophosphate synthase
MHNNKRAVKTKFTAQQAHELLCKYGKKAFTIAQKIIHEENIENRNVRETLNYFMQEVWHDLEYPGFMALACKAVKGDPDKTSQFGAALILIRGAMDIHDDIIDQQSIKAGKPTVFGKYGQDLSILAGDVLFYEGLVHLNKASLKLREEERQTIVDMVKKAFFEVGIGVASEVDYKGNFDLMKEDGIRIIIQKSACAEMHARVGATIGGGSKEEVDALGKFGRSLGILTIIRDEFVDIYEPDELQNRKDKECLPLPLLFALQHENVKNKVLPILKKTELTEEDSQKIIDIISHSKGISELKTYMNKTKKGALSSLNVIKVKETKHLLKSLLEPVFENI